MFVLIFLLAQFLIIYIFFFSKINTNKKIQTQPNLLFLVKASSGHAVTVQPVNEYIYELIINDKNALN